MYLNVNLPKLDINQMIDIKFTKVNIVEFNFPHLLSSLKWSAIVILGLSFIPLEINLFEDYSGVENWRTSITEKARSRWLI